VAMGGILAVGRIRASAEGAGPNAADG